MLAIRFAGRLGLPYAAFWHRGMIADSHSALARGILHVCPTCRICIDSLGLGSPLFPQGCVEALVLACQLLSE